MDALKIQTQLRYRLLGIILVTVLFVLVYAGLYLYYIVPQDDLLGIDGRDTDISLEVFMGSVLDSAIK